MSASRVWPHQIHAVIFDNDGLLLDTEPIGAKVHEQLTGHHFEIDFRRKLMGLTAPDACKLIVEKFNLPYTWEEFSKMRDEILVKVFPTAELFAGAKELVQELIARKIPISVATSSSRTNFESKIVNHKEFFSQFNKITCGNEVSKGKPDPEIFLTSMKQLGFLKPENILVFEDAPSGVKAANNAGMAVVMVPDHELPVQIALEEVDAHPTVILKSLKDFDFNAFDWQNAK